MKILIACEYSGIVREAFRRRGHDAWSCDILPTELPGQHIEGGAENVLRDGWDMLIAHPPCTYLTVTGNKWFNHPDDKHLPTSERRPHPRFPDRQRQREEAMEFFLMLANAPIEKIAIENPVGVVSTLWRRPDQYIQPYHFGEPHSKKTGLWLKNLPPLKTTKIVEPEWHIYKDGRRDPMWHVETMKLSPHERMKARSKTFLGVAEAMAEQWG
ncbi:hypothetical protein KAR91_59050 [Candidatus Pacearchaeota archaeon]|nr:hypothetical protein [Candidatus Pacearchaeota archaeon]